MAKFIHNQRSVLSVTVILIQNGISDQRSNLVYVSLFANTLRKRVLVYWVGSFALVSQQVWKKKTEFKPALFPHKNIDSTSYPADGGMVW